MSRPLIKLEGVGNHLFISASFSPRDNLFKAASFAREVASVLCRECQTNVTGLLIFV